MATFTPPGVVTVPPVNYADTKTGAATRDINPQGWNLMRYMPSRTRGVNVWLLGDGTYMMSETVPGVTFTGTIGWPYPDTLDPVNNAISSSWFPGGPGGTGSSGPGGLQQPVTPGITTEYLGGHTYTITAAEAAALTATGLGAYLT